MTIQDTKQQSVAVRPPQQAELLPNSYQEVAGLAKAFVASGMFSDVKQISQAIVKIQAGRELGLPPIYSMMNVNVIRNRLTTSANCLALLVKRSGRYDYRITESTDAKCTITFSERHGQQWETIGTEVWTMDDAQRAGLVKPDGGWTTYPRAMLFSRAISAGARKYCPDAIGGVYTDEEIRTLPLRPDDPTPVLVDGDTGEIQDAPEPPPPVKPQSTTAKATEAPPAPSQGQQQPLPERWEAFVKAFVAQGRNELALAKFIKEAFKLALQDLANPPAGLTPAQMATLEDQLARGKEQAK